MPHSSGTNEMWLEEILDLGVGQISGAAPVQLGDLLQDALKPPFNAYSPPAGIPAVRETVARLLGVEQGGSSVVMTTGASGGFLAFLLVSRNLRPNPRLAVPDPCYPAFLGVCRRLGITTDAYRVKGRHIDFESFQDALKPDTIGAVIITPGNPEGVALHADDVRQAELMAAENDVALVLDQSYADLTPCTIPQATLQLLHHRSTHLRSFSKSYALSGHRCGAMITLPTSSDVFAQAHFAALLSAPTLAQMFAVRCLEPNVREQFLENTRHRLTTRHAAMSGAVADIPGVSVPSSDIGLFAWIHLPYDSRKIAAHLSSQGIVVVPGTAFGTQWPNHIRVLSDIPKSSVNRFVTALRQCIEVVGNE